MPTRSSSLFAQLRCVSPNVAINTSISVARKAIPGPLYLEIRTRMMDTSLRMVYGFQSGLITTIRKEVQDG